MPDLVSQLVVDLRQKAGDLLEFVLSRGLDRAEPRQLERVVWQGQPIGPRPVRQGQGRLEAFEGLSELWIGAKRHGQLHPVPGPTSLGVAEIWRRVRRG